VFADYGIEFGRDVYASTYFVADSITGAVQHLLQ
jgi:hypothetical protein